MKREFSFLGNKENAFIKMNMNSFSPSLWAKTIVPEDDSFKHWKTFEGKITFSGYYVYDNNVPITCYPLFRSSVPFYCSNIKKGFIEEEIPSLDMRFHFDVELSTTGLPVPPTVVVSPVTDNPVAVKASVTNITKKGFTIWVYRKDAIGTLRVNWIAMY